MATPRTPRRRPDAPSVAPTTLHEITRRYYATAITLAKAMGLPMSEQFIHEYRESIACCFIAADRAGVRLPSAVQLPPLGGAPAAANGQPDGTTSNGPEPAPPAAVVPTDGTAVPEPPTNGDAPKPTVIPTDADLPCGGQAISALKPASLSMLINKVARLLQDEGERWVRLLHALERERNARLERGRKAPRPEGAADGA